MRNPTIARMMVAGLAGLLALPLMATAKAQTATLDSIRNSHVLRVGTTGDYKPFTFLDTKTGNYEGFDIDFAKDLAAKLGVKLVFVQTKWADLMKDFAANKFDIAMGGISVTLPRQAQGFFSTPYLREGKAAIAPCSEAKRFPDLAAIDKPGVKVIVNPGGTNEKFDHDHLKAAEIVLNKDNLSIFDQLAAGKADLMITDASETRYQQKLHTGTLCAIHPDKPFDFAEKAYWLPRDEPLRQYVNQWLHIDQNDGTFAKIYGKWLQ